MSDNFDDYDDYDDYDSDQDFFDQEESRVDTPTDFEEPTGRQTNNNRIWYIIGALLGIPLLCGAICVGITFVTDISILNQLEEIVPLAELTGEDTADTSAMITLVPTADLSVLYTPTPIPPTPTPTATPGPAVGEFLSPADGDSLTLNEFYELKAHILDGNGITNVQIQINRGQNVFSQPYSGDTEVTYTNNWAPVSDGRNTLTLEITNITGERIVLDEITVRVIDEKFLERNAETFSKVQDNVAAIRGLALQTDVYPYLMGEGELRRYLRENGYTEEEARLDSAVLSVFDFVDRGYDLYEASTQYAGLTIAGFYDPSTKDFVLISNDNELNALEEYVYAHELIHALQDQYFTLGDLTNEESGFNFEQALALRALAEGEAELVQELYLEEGYFSYEERVEIFNVSQTLYRPVQTTIDPPQILVETFAFPYEKGLDFVRTAYNRGGWEAVDALWANPPQSTEHILNPSTYFNGEQPIEVTLAPSDEVLVDWTLIRDDVFGEYYLNEFFKQQLSVADSNYGSLGWGGDRYHVYIQGDPADPMGINETALIWRLAWDDANESDHFGRVFKLYADAAYGTNYLTDIPETTCRTTSDIVCTRAIGTDWLIVRAPDMATAEALINVQLAQATTE